MEAAEAAASAASAAARDASLAASAAEAAAAKDAAVASATAEEATADAQEAAAALNAKEAATTALAVALSAKEVATTVWAAALDAKEAAAVAATTGEVAMQASKKHKFNLINDDQDDPLWRLSDAKLERGASSISPTALDAKKAAAVVVSAVGAAMQASKKPKLHHIEDDPPRSEDVDDGDFIGRLPDAILSIILLLPTKEGARTQLVSRRWRLLSRAAPLNLVAAKDLIPKILQASRPRMPLLAMHFLHRSFRLGPRLA